MKTLNYAVVLLLIHILICSCNDFLDVDLTKSQVISSKVYSNDVIATSAVNGIYTDMLDVQNFASGSGKSLTVLAGLSADELNSYSTDLDLAAFNENVLREDNVWVLSLWRSLYKIIYQANSVIEGLKNSDALSNNVRSQLLGEAKFVRAFCHFYLVNLFGDIPLILGTDYRSNSMVSRTPSVEIYRQIIQDLKEAQVALGDQYPTSDRGRPNRFVATALLSRVYLYQKDWNSAEAEATSIIENGTYRIVEDVNYVFKVSSEETIWQLIPVDPNINTQEAYTFILSGTPVNNTLTPNAITEELVELFEPGDLRFSNWIGSYYDQVDSSTWYYPFKYKTLQGSNPVVDEGSVVFRLAEQFLIRAEARVQLSNLEGAINDIDTLRFRAGLPSIVDIGGAGDNVQLLKAIDKERRLEFFAEWGHRWFDLKRRGNANEDLRVVKPGWNAEDVLYPIPQAERLRNSNLSDQNPGY